MNDEPPGADVSEAVTNSSDTAAMKVDALKWRKSQIELNIL